jgi:hypothetical protein
MLSTRKPEGCTQEAPVGAPHLQSSQPRPSVAEPEYSTNGPCEYPEPAGHAAAWPGWLTQNVNEGGGAGRQNSPPPHEPCPGTAVGAHSNDWRDQLYGGSVAVGGLGSHDPPWAVAGAISNEVHSAGGFTQTEVLSTAGLLQAVAQFGSE